MLRHIYNAYRVYCYVKNMRQAAGVVSAGTDGITSSIRYMILGCGRKKTENHQFRPVVPNLVSLACPLAAYFHKLYGAFL